jgi:hypothetical protein
MQNVNVNMGFPLILFINELNNILFLFCFFFLLLFQLSLGIFHSSYTLQVLFLSLEEEKVFWRKKLKPIKFYSISSQSVYSLMTFTIRVEASTKYISKWRKKKVLNFTCTKVQALERRKLRVAMEEQVCE